MVSLALSGFDWCRSRILRSSWLKKVLLLMCSVHYCHPILLVAYEAVEVVLRHEVAPLFPHQTASQLIVSGDESFHTLQVLSFPVGECITKANVGR